MEFPSQNDINLIKDLIHHFLTDQSGTCRDRMLYTIRVILDKYRISKYNLGNFSIHTSLEPGLSFIYGTNQIFDPFCPGCGYEIYHLNSPVTILSIAEGIKDRVTYGCRCGQIFVRIEEK